MQDATEVFDCGRGIVFPELDSASQRQCIRVTRILLEHGGDEFGSGVIVSLIHLDRRDPIADRQALRAAGVAVKRLLERRFGFRQRPGALQQGSEADSQVEIVRVMRDVCTKKLLSVRTRALYGEEVRQGELRVIALGNRCDRVFQLLLRLIHLVQADQVQGELATISEILRIELDQLADLRLG